MKNSRADRSRLPLMLGLLILGCSRAQTDAAPGNTVTSAAVQAPPEVAAGKVKRVVFVGKEHACDCTRKTVETSWAALQQALGVPAKVPVDRLQIDTQPEQVAPYRGQRPVMALPGIYFIDGTNTVIELLQGEVTKEQIAAALAK
jgi:hypothetical protein